MNAPVERYLAPQADMPAIDGPVRWIERRGRRGLNATSVHTRLRFDRHTVGDDRGALALWVLPLETLAPAAALGHIVKHEPDHHIVPLLSDLPSLRDREQARFHLRYTTDWWRNLTAQFHRLGASTPGQKAIIAPDHFRLAGLRWHQVTATWDRPAGRYRLYVNGVRVASETQFLPVADERPDGPLFGGCPALALADVCFFDAALSEAEVASWFRACEASPDADLQADLRRMHAGEGLARVAFDFDASWSTRLDLSLTEPSHADALHVQGQPDAHRITPDGLHVRTAPEPPGFRGAWTQNLVETYYWTRRPFEGDVALEVDFRLHRRNGLALVMIQAAGMQREDFMADHPLRTGGEMSMVCWENVRNYHWEFYREIDNTRNDTASHLLVKNPWMAGLAYQCQPAPFDLDRWHTLRLVQEGPRLRGAIDDTLIFDVVDRDDIFTGPILTFGRVALRCKYKTEMTFRNLRVRTREGAFAPVEGVEARPAARRSDSAAQAEGSG